MQRLLIKADLNKKAAVHQRLFFFAFIGMNSSASIVAAPDGKP